MCSQLQHRTPQNIMFSLYPLTQLILFSFTETRFMSALHLSSCFLSFCVFLCGCKPVWQRDRCFICTLSDAISLCNLLLSNRRSLRIKMGNKTTGHLHLQLAKCNEGTQLTNYIYIHTYTHKRMWSCMLRDSSSSYTKFVPHKSVAI